MAVDEEKLLELKQKIDTAKTTVAELTGQRKSMMTQMKETWGCKTLEEADKKLEKMNKEIKDLDDEIKKRSAEIEEKYKVE
jgi:uncharacterized protein YukE